MAFLSRFFKRKATPVHNPARNQGWFSLAEPFTGAWQTGQTLKREDVLQFHAVFSCVSLIAQDVAKLPLELRQKQGNIWQKIEDKNFKLLKKPNHYQTLQQFIEYWIVSKLTYGNTYVLKVRDIFNGKIVGLQVLNPALVVPMIDNAGNVYYQLKLDYLNQVNDIILPESEIIHDRMNCFYHPLVGLSPISACALSANHGLSIQHNAKNFFENMSRPSGMLVAPTAIDDDTAQSIRKRWQENYSQGNYGRTAIMGNDIKYVPLNISASDSQLLEQLKLSAEVVCSVFRVPAFKIGLVGLTQGVKAETLNEIYYTDCLQPYIEAIENLLDEHLNLAEFHYEVFFDLDNLIRMDSLSKIEFYEKGVKSGILSPNEARAKFNYAPVAGGDTPYMQQQNFSLEALSKRDSTDNPFDKTQKQGETS